MEIQVRTDRNVTGAPELIAEVEREVIDGLHVFSDRITTVQVHLGDENGDKWGDADSRCMIEVRPNGHPPVAVTHHAATMDEAISGAARQMHARLESLFGRLDDRHPGAPTIRGR